MTLIAIIRNDRSPTTNEKLQFTSWTRCKRHDIKRENGMSREWQFRPMEEGWQASYRSRSLLQYGACHDPAGSIHHVDRSRGGRQRQVNDIQFSPRWDSFVRIVTREVLICDLNGFPLFFFLLSLLVKFIDGLNVIGMFLFQLFLLRDWNLFTYFSFFFFLYWENVKVKSWWNLINKFRMVKLKRGKNFKLITLLRSRSEIWKVMENYYKF